MSSPEAVLDASALLALVHNEPGAATVEGFLPRGGLVMSTVNFSEAVGKIAECGKDAEVFSRYFRALGISLIDLTEGIAFDAGQLKLRTRAFGLSLGDRVCLALARDMGLPALTTDSAWERVGDGYKVILIR